MAGLVPPTSALQNLITSHPPSPQALAAAQDSGGPDAHLIIAAQHSLALQVAHNLRHQHNWSDVCLHESFGSGDCTSSAPSTPTAKASLRVMISGLPPQRQYIHPDEQIEFLKQQAVSVKAGSANAGTPESKLSPEREWVLPTHLREKWSLRRFAAVFDRIDKIPRSSTGKSLFKQDLHGRPQSTEADSNVDGGHDEQTDGVNPWRINQPKRLLLATVDDDSTIVYYVVHDGIVKPRQN